jgi:hypothetical protein
VEVVHLLIVENVTCRQFVECGLVVEDSLLQGVEVVFVSFLGHGGVGLSISDGLEETIGDTSEKDCIQVWLHL